MAQLRARHIYAGSRPLYPVAACGPAGAPNNSDTFGTAWGHPADDRYWPTFARRPVDDSVPVALREFQVPQFGVTNANCDNFRAHAHSGNVIMVGLGDGSVRSLSPNMDNNLWWAALTPAGNEVQDW